MAGRESLTRRQFIHRATAATLVPAALADRSNAVESRGVVLENDDLKYVIGNDGRNLHFIDKRSGRDRLVPGKAYTFVNLRKNGTTYHPTSCWLTHGALTASFEQANATVVVRVLDRKRYFLLEVASVEGTDIEELTVVNLCVDMTQGVGRIANVAWDGEFAAGVMALNLETRAGMAIEANEMGGGQEQPVLWAACYPRIGLVGARVGVIGCPSDKFREAIKQMVLEDGFVRSEVGGAWALEAEENRSSYLFAYATEEDVDEWIDMAKLGGFGELLISDIGPYGHYVPNPRKYPRGLASVKSVLDRVHAAGLKAGWHMLGFIISRNDPWVAPVPDQRLLARSRLTLASPLSADATSVETVESPRDLPLNSGFWFRGGMDILVEEEILTYSGVETSPPYRLTGCKRGAHGTRAAAHHSGAALRNLQEVFGNYVPDPDSTLMAEMEERLAEIIRTCEFDKIYFDGLDGADVFAGRKWSWYYGPRFAVNVFRRALSRDGAGRALRRLQVEASAWYHHTWHITSRLGAWDHPVRSLKSFLGLHVATNRRLGDLLPTQLGWWAFNPYRGRLGVASTQNEIEYLGAKCLANDMAVSLEEVTPATLRERPQWKTLLETLGRYETLRLKRYFPESLVARLRAPGEEFILTKDTRGDWWLAPVTVAEHKVTAIDGARNVFRVTNRFGPARARFRIQALVGAGPEDALESALVTDFHDPGAFRLRDAAPGVECRLETSEEFVKRGGASGKPAAAGKLTATSTRGSRRGAWASVGLPFDPPLNLAQHPALGVWVHGDGMGEVLNVQLVDIRGPGPALGEHYVVVDFVGWRYFELIEPEGKRWSDYVWPYGGPTVVYRESVEEVHIAELNLYFNNLPPQSAVVCFLAPIKALPIETLRLENPRLTLGGLPAQAGKTLRFPVTLESGQFIEFRAPDDCALYDPNGGVLRRFSAEGDTLVLGAGENEIAFASDGPPGANARALITTMLTGPPL